MATQIHYSEPMHTLDGGWYRRVTANDDHPAVNVHMTGRDDSTYALRVDGYDSRCSACWLGHAHSLALHQRFLLA